MKGSFPPVGKTQTGFPPRGKENKGTQPVNPFCSFASFCKRGKKKNARKLYSVQKKKTTWYRNVEKVHLGLPSSTKVGREVLWGKGGKGNDNRRHIAVPTRRTGASARALLKCPRERTPGQSWASYVAQSVQPSLLFT